MRFRSHADSRPSFASRGALRPMAIAGALALMLDGTATGSQEVPPPTPDEASMEVQFDPRLESGQVAAVGGDQALLFPDFDILLVERFGMASPGEQAVRFLAGVKLIEQAAAEVGVRVSDEELRSRLLALDEQVRSAGAPDGLLAELTNTRLSSERFRETLRTALLHERLTRLALDLPANEPVSPGSQELWLEQTLREQGWQRLPRPWVNGVVGLAGETPITEAELAGTLRDQLPHEDLYTAARHMLLAQSVEAALGDASKEELAAAIEKEIGRRRAEAAANPRYQGVPFESLLAAQGQTPELFRRDPVVRIAAYSSLWTDRKHDDTSLRAAYDSEAEFYDDRFGQAIRTRLLFLQAGPVATRDFEQAESEILTLGRRVTNEDSFAALVRERSEERNTAPSGGDLGYVTRKFPGLPEEFLDAIWGEAEGQALPRLSNPVRLSAGVGLFWLGHKRPAPPWSELKGYVRTELRRRFLVERVPAESIQTYLDLPFDPGPLLP